MKSYSHILIDALNLAHRCWWPVRDFQTTSGSDNSLEYGFGNSLVALQRRFTAAQLILAWDGEPRRQKAAYAAYKAQRQARRGRRPLDWHPRCDRLREALAGTFATLYDPHNEADVEIARYLRHEQPNRSLIVSTDRDLLMLLNESVDVLRPGMTPELWERADFDTEYGFGPARYPLYKALVGDRSDNIKGVGHFPTRVAAKLAGAFEGVDQLYRELRSREHPAVAELTKNQRDKLVAGEKQVRSNVRVVDLLADTRKPHFQEATGKVGPLRELLEGLEIGVADELTGELPVAVDTGPLLVSPPDKNGTARAAGNGLSLLGDWAKRLEARRRQQEQQGQPKRLVPMAPAYFADGVKLVQDAAGAQSLLDFARQRPLAFIGMDFEFRYSRPGVAVKKDHTWNDPRSIEPLLLALALVEPQADGATKLYRFVVDVRQQEVLAPLQHLLKLPLPFVAHYGQVELFCLWQLALPAPGVLWDTWTAERAFLLGIYHGRYQNQKPRDEVEEARAEEEADDQIDFNCKLTTTCLRRGVPYPFAGNKERLQKSFMSHPAGQPFTQEQLDYAAADAEAAARLYSAQVQVAVERGCLDHLTTLEMPWTITNARMIWDGVRVDQTACMNLRHACQRNAEQMSAELTELGVGNVNSHPQLHRFFQSINLLDAFKVKGKYAFDDEHLEAVEDRYPAIATIRDLRKTLRLTKDKVLTGELIGSDGRLHPEHRQLGAESGRNSMSWPNIGGIGRALRPLVVPDDGYLIGEVDLSQIEVGIAAAVYGEPDLIRMFNGRDVYTAMAKRYYAEELSAEDQTVPDKTFKKKHRHLRDRMKVFTLATIYNITPFGLSLRLNITPERAAEEQARFLAMFPSLAQALREASELGSVRGFAYLCSGLRRWRARSGTATSWEINWMRNTPVQGSAGVVFKAAGNRLYRRYQHYGAKLILPMHDAFVFEVPQQHLSTVAKITAEVMRSTVQEYFPELEPQVDINIDHPHCWNKDGKHRSLTLWTVKPELARRYL